MRHRHGPAARLYGIILHHTPPEPLPAGVHLVSHRELSAVVSDETPGRRAPARPPDLTQHRSVVTALFAQGSIVPVQPGVVFPRADTLLGWLELHYAALSDAMSYIDGRGEARVHVRHGVSATEGRWDTRSRPATEGLHIVALEMFHELGDHVVAWSLVPSASSAMRPAAAASTAPGATGAPQPAQVAAGDGSVHTGRDVGEISASFLVERSRWREFADAVGAEARRMPGLEIVLSGPWPPYDFVRLEFGG